MYHFMSRAAGALMAAAVAVSPAVAAEGFLYDCDMSGFKRGKGWISPKLALVFPGDGSVKVVDAVVLHFQGGPVQGKIVRENSKRLIVKWTVKGAVADSGVSFANFDYRASISKTSGKIELTAVPREFDSGVRSGGSCRKRKK